MQITGPLSPSLPNLLALQQWCGLNHSNPGHIVFLTCNGFGLLLDDGVFGLFLPLPRSFLIVSPLNIIRGIMSQTLWGIGKHIQCLPSPITQSAGLAKPSKMFGNYEHSYTGLETFLRNRIVYIKANQYRPNKVVVKLGEKDPTPSVPDSDQEG